MEIVWSEAEIAPAKVSRERRVHQAPARAKRDGQIPSLEFEMDRLVQDAGFFVSDRVRNTFLAEAGESP